jgi:hypothetical protein
MYLIFTSSESNKSDNVGRYHQSFIHKLINLKPLNTIVISTVAGRKFICVNMIR